MISNLPPVVIPLPTCPHDLCHQTASDELLAGDWPRNRADHLGHLHDLEGNWQSAGIRYRANRDLPSGRSSANDDLTFEPAAGRLRPEDKPGDSGSGLARER